MVLDWLKTQSAAPSGDGTSPPAPSQGLLWTLAPYQEDAPAIVSSPELAGAIEHLHYAVFRRYQQPVDPRRAVATR